ncbi:hypothetical protein ASG69_06990 [Rhodococcus sp. Leaf225]|nr:hypothetical protein ASG69_06990 [Rhodococcus sp. Leaf225]
MGRESGSDLEPDQTGADDGHVPVAGGCPPEGTEILRGPEDRKRFALDRGEYPWATTARQDNGVPRQRFTVIGDHVPAIHVESHCSVTEHERNTVLAESLCGADFEKLRFATAEKQPFRQRRTVVGMVQFGTQDGDPTFEPALTEPICCGKARRGRPDHDDVVRARQGAHHDGPGP